MPDEPIETDEAAATDEPVASGDEGAEPEEDAPLNRAERRAKGKNKQAAPQPGHTRVTGRGPDAGPRQWANRRSG